MKNKHKIVSLVAGAIALGTVVTPVMALAQTSTSTVESKPEAGRESHAGKMFKRSEMVARAGKGVHGTVVSVSGSIITITDKNNVTYTVDTTNAKFDGGMMGNTLTFANILMGDKIQVRGTITGTNIVATMVSDKSYMDRTVFSGKVTAVTGSTITLVQNKNTTLTVNVGTATLKKGFGQNAKTISASDVAVGDRLTVVGTLSGTTVTATSGEDMGAHPMFGHMMKEMKGKK